MDIVKSVTRYEAWLERQLGGDINRDDIAEKHEKMAGDAFQFLRATYWRWAETIYQACPALKSAPQVLAVGDIHVENFGTWRDAEGRLVWGVNDFDEAAHMPYAIDVVRLATSGALARVRGMTPKIVCKNILGGYRDGLSNANPAPFLLDRGNEELRRKVQTVSEKERARFWKKSDPDLIAEQVRKAVDRGQRPKVRQALGMSRRYQEALDWARPDKSIVFKHYYERTAGTGSLGRPRYMGVGRWMGDYVVREAKAMVPSGWALAHTGSRALRCEAIARSRHRCPDPTYRLSGSVLVRRLSPNDFKIEAKQGGDDRKEGKAEGGQMASTALVDAEMLKNMGHDLALVHRGARHPYRAIEDDLEQRGDDWLAEAVEHVQKLVKNDFEDWRSHYEKTKLSRRKGKSKAKK